MKMCHLSCTKIRDCMANGSFLILFLVSIFHSETQRHKTTMPSIHTFNTGAHKKTVFTWNCGFAFHLTLNKWSEKNNSDILDSGKEVIALTYVSMKN